MLGLFGTISLGWFGVGQRVGDGTGFYMMFFAWAENFTPYSTERVGKKFVEYVKPRPEWEGDQHYYSPDNPIRKNGTADEGHFWLYSMLAAVFYWPLKLLGADVGLSFNCLHVVLLYVAVVLIHRRLGAAAACSLIILVVASPRTVVCQQGPYRVVHRRAGFAGYSVPRGRRTLPFGRLLRPGGHAKPVLRTGFAAGAGNGPREPGMEESRSPIGSCSPWLRPCWPCIPFTIGFARGRQARC